MAHRDILPPSSSLVAWKRHISVALALIFNIGTVSLIVSVHRKTILLPSNPTPAQRSMQSILPALGAIVGSVVAAVNACAISLLVTAYARTVIIGEGMTFGRIDHLYTIANAKIPLAMTPLIFLAIVIALAEGLLPSAIVSSLTPTAVEWTLQRSLPIADFSADSGARPNIICEYYDTRENTNAPGHGYGINCPIDDKFGDLYNVALTSFWGEVPANSTRDGVTYPSTLLGISGAFSSIMRDNVRTITSDENRAVIASDYVETCLPRMVVQSDCVKALPRGEYFNFTWHPVDGGIPQAMIQTAHCFNATNSCDVPSRYAPFYGNGVSIVFWNMDPTSGNTTLSLYNFASYKDVWGTEEVQCEVSAREELIPVRIHGDAHLEPFPDFDCPSGRAQPSPQFLLNVTRMADMTIIKLQGQDGSIEPAAAIPQGRDRVEALSLALKNIVAMGATEMYAKIYDDKSLAAQWTGEVPINYVTTRTRLGNTTDRSLAFLLCPLILILVLIAGTIIVSRRSQPNIAFNPLHPASAMAAGMNRQELCTLVRQHNTADEAALCELPVVLRFRPVTDDRWGIDTKATHPESLLRRDGSTYMSLENLNGATSPWSPDSLSAKGDHHWGAEGDIRHG